MFTDNRVVSGHPVAMLADRSGSSERCRDEAREGEGGWRKVEEANGRGAATGVLVHGLVTQERQQEGGEDGGMKGSIDA